VKLYTTDPLSDNRWDELVAHHPNASIFHERAWLEALARTYKYPAFVLSSSPPGDPLRNGIVLCRVASWITGTRAVSLPFADHCEPLLQQGDDRFAFAIWLREECDRQGWKYVELRPLFWNEKTIDALAPSQSYAFHMLDLTPSLGEIFQAFHKSSMQRRIRKAEKEKLSYEVGSRDLLEPFYELLVMTRKRHHLIPQPRAWFKNLVDCMGDKLQIRLARKNGRPIAAILSLRHRSTVTYKYGCSNDKFHNLAGMSFLFWKLIEESKNSGATSIDLGRSELDQVGLLTFKNRLGANQQPLTYFRYPRAAHRDAAQHGGLGAIRRMISLLPDAALPIAGRALYRHLG